MLAPSTPLPPEPAELDRLLALVSGGGSAAIYCFAGGYITGFAAVARDAAALNGDAAAALNSLTTTIDRVECAKLRALLALATAGGGA